MDSATMDVSSAQNCFKPFIQCCGPCCWLFRVLSSIIRKVKLNQSYDDVSVIIPGKTLIEISKIINGGMDDEVSIFFTDKHVLFEFEDTIVLSRLIEGEYYKIDKMLSTDYETKVTVNKREMLECIDRSTLLLKESDKKPVIIDVQDLSLIHI